MPAEEIYRTAALRSHRILGAYLIHRAWIENVDCVVVTRNELMRFLDLATMQRNRLTWLTDDLKAAFPHSRPLFKTKGGAWSALYLSRLEFPEGFPWGSMPTQKRTKQLGKVGLRTAEVSILREAEVLARLAELAHGLVAFDR
jgi:hypothetical protein